MRTHLLLYATISFTLSLLFFPVLIKLLKQWNIFDSPGSNKIHLNYTPSMGGVCIAAGAFITLLISLPLAEWVAQKYFFIALAVMFIVGLRDDILALTPLRKLVGQFLPVLILVVFGATALDSLYEIVPYIFPFWLSWLITVFTIIILTNAYNLIDGLDGLAGSIAIVILAFFGCWFYVAGNYYFSILAFSFWGSILAFLIFNWQPSKIFMGDTGTLSIGFVISFLSINFINTNFGLSTNSPVHFSASISTAISVLIIPVFDTVRVVILRLGKLQSPFKADHNHLHHQFINLGFSHAQTTLILVGINALFVALAWILRNQSDKLILPIIIILCFIIHQALKIAQRKNEVATER